MLTNGGMEQDSQEEPRPYDGLGFLKLDFVPVQCCTCSNEDAQPAKSEADVGVYMDLFEQVRPGEVLGMQKYEWV